MKKRTGEPWMSAGQYGHSLRGLTVNLIVRNMARMLEFQQHVLEANTVYEDPDFAVFEGYGAQWMAHADHTYDHNPVGTLLTLKQPRGGLVELRIHGCDPDRAVQQAKQRGYEVVQTAADKSHGLREAYLRDAEGYLWVPDRSIASTSS
jgi:uncharacterized glyoxalase superfamily protein PhnB